MLSVGTHSLHISISMLYQQNRKKHNAESKRNETSKRQRLSVLRLSGETKTEGVGRSAPSRACSRENFEECPGLTSILLDGGEDGREEEPTSVNESSKDVHLDHLDHSIVQFTVGANDPMDVLLPGHLAKTNPSDPSECTPPLPLASWLMIFFLTGLFLKWFQFFTIRNYRVE